MKKIILTAIGLAMFAMPVAADSPKSGHPDVDNHIFGSERLGYAHQIQVRTPDRVFLAPAGSQSFGVALGMNPAESHLAGSYQAPRDRYGPIHR